MPLRSRFRHQGEGEGDVTSWVDQRRRRRRAVNRLIIAAAVVIVVIVAVRTFMGLYVDWLWFGEVDLREIFWRRAGFGLVLGPVFGAVFFALIYGNVEIARRCAPKHQVFEGIADLEYVRADIAHWVRRMALVLTSLVAIAVGFGAAGAWLTFARALYATPFAAQDPIFHHDLGFYVFTVPAWQYVYSFLFSTLFVALVVAILVHLMMGSIELQMRPDEAPHAPEEQEGTPPLPVEAVRHIRRITGFHLERSAVAQLSALLGALFVLAGLGYLLKAWNLLLSTSGAAFGAGYTDVHVRLPIIRVLMVLALFLGAALIYNAARRRNARWLLIAVGSWIVASILFLGIVPAAYQALIVSPNQLEKELPYVADNLKATRSAYDLNAISEAPFALKGDLSSAKLAANSGTVGNIRLWDPEALQRSYKQLQQLRPYYSFTTVSVDRYRVKGDDRQTMLSPRELNVSGLPVQAQTWVNQHITYTHGFGVTVSAVNQVASDGSPDFLVQDVPVTSDAAILTVKQPRIYYGLKGTDYLLVKTTNPEFDYPGEGGDVYRNYEGDGGIPIDSFFNRLAFCVKFGTLKFLTTTVIKSGSRSIISNDIEERVARAAPFLAYDRSPYMVIAHGRLFWIIDAYTTSSRIPYSEPLNGLNYIRNSVKVVIDAYNGGMSFYVFDTSDPIIRAYQEMFPGVLQPADAMDETLRQHVRYPQDRFAVQAELFATYHVTDPGVLYNKGDQWQIPTNVSITGAGQMSPYYMIMRLPGQLREEFVLILPFTPNERSNMIGWLAAESDRPNYGKAVSFQFPANLSVYGPAQVEAAVNQDPVISAQRTLWGQAGSRVIFGNLIVVPIEDALLYVQPLYLESESTRLPQVQRVIVFYRSPSATPDLPTGQQQNVVMAPTLANALSQIFGGVAPPTKTSAPGGATSREFALLAAQANTQYAAAQEALRTGDLEEFGRQIKLLGKTLAQLKTRQ